METLPRNSLERVPLLCTLPPQIPSHSGLALSWASTDPLFSSAVTYIGVFPWPDYIPSTNGMTGNGFVCQGRTLSVRVCFNHLSSKCV